MFHVHVCLFNIYFNIPNEVFKELTEEVDEVLETGFPCSSIEGVLEIVTEAGWGFELVALADCWEVVSEGVVGCEVGAGEVPTKTKKKK